MGGAKGEERHTPNNLPSPSHSGQRWQRPGAHLPRLLGHADGSRPFPFTRRRLIRSVHRQVEDPSGHALFEKRGLSSGQFAFTTKEDGDFKACFTAKGAGV